MIQVAGGSYPAQVVIRTNPAKPAPAVSFVAAGGSVTVSGTLALGQNNGSSSGNTPDHLSFDGINVSGGCLQTFYNGGSQSTDLTFRNAHIQALNNSCHLVYLQSSDHVLIQNVELGPMCCNGDAVEFGIPRSGAPNPSNITLDNVYIHDIYDSCSHVPSGFGQCSGQGYGSGCGICDHVDGLQAFGGTNLTIQNSRVYAINPGGAVGQGIFFQSANGGRFSNITLSGDKVSSAPNNDVSFAGPGNSVFSGAISIVQNTFSGDFHIYDRNPGPDSRVIAPGTSIQFANNIIGSMTDEGTTPLCTITTGSGGSMAPSFSHNLFGNAKCGSTDAQGVASFVSTNLSAPNLTVQAGSLGAGLGSSQAG